MRIWADNREDTKTLKKGKKVFPNMKITQLPVGDVVIENGGKYLCVEHKEGNDFNASIKDQRLTSQPIGMLDKFDYNFVFVEGTYSDMIQQCDFSSLTEQMYNGKISSLALKYVVPPITVDNTGHFWRMLESFAKKLKYAGEPLTKPIILPNKHDNLETRMMMCFKGLAVERASSILKKFDFWELPNISEDDLMTVPGIGEKYANSIKTQIRKKWF